MSFSAPQAVPSGTELRVLEVQGHPPTSLVDFDGDIDFVVGEDLHYLVRGSGSVTGEVVRFYEKDVENNGKDIRVWQVRQGEATFVAEHLAQF